MFKKTAYPGARRTQAQAHQAPNAGPSYNPHASYRPPPSSASSGSPPPLSDPHGWFSYFDRDGSGSLDQEEVIAGLVRTHPNLNADSVREQVYAVWPAFDSDGSGRVDRVEFCGPGGMGEALLAATTRSSRRATPQAQGGGGDGGHWTCGRCTFVNSAGTPHCKACRSPAPQSAGGGGGYAAPSASGPYVPGAPPPPASSSGPYVPTSTASASAAAASSSGPYVPTAASSSGPYVPTATPVAAASSSQPYVPQASVGGGGGGGGGGGAQVEAYSYGVGGGASAPPPAQNPHYRPSAPPPPPPPSAPSAPSQPYRPAQQPPSSASYAPAAAQGQQQGRQQFQTVRVNVPPGMRPGQQLGVKTDASSAAAPTMVTIPPRDQWRYPPGGGGGPYFDVRVPKPAAPVVVQGSYSGRPSQQQGGPSNAQQQQQQHLLPWKSWDSFGGHAYQPIPLGMQTVPPEQVAPPHMVSSVPATGRRRALLVGINYRGTRAELRGCVNDAKNMRELLLSSGFRDDPTHMIMLVDEGTSGNYRPTRQNILRGMQWLVHNACPGDVLFFHFSGHGAQEPDRTGHEADGFNETILPADFKSGGQISDDVIWGNLVWPLPGGVRLTALMDCCHSGTGLDLPFEYDLRRRRWVEEVNPAHSRGDVVQFSGCEDAQTSADAGGDALSKYQAGGAMTQSFIRAYGENPSATYPRLMDAIHRHLKMRGFSQRPALTTSQSFDVGSRVFSISDGIEPNRNAQIGRIKRKHIRPGRGNQSLQETLFGGLGAMATGASAVAGIMAIGNVLLGD